MASGIAHNVPKFYGSVTVGERGQVVIPAEARHELDIMPAAKLLVFGSPGTKMVCLIKVELVSEFLKTFNHVVQNLEEALQEVIDQRSINQPSVEVTYKQAKNKRLPNNKR